MRPLQEKMITDEIKKLIPVLGKETAQNLLKTYLLADEETKQRLTEMVDVVKAAVFTDKDMQETVLLEPPDQTVATKGDFEIGKILYGKKSLYPLMIDRKNLLTHVGVFGSSGFGKTNIAYNFIENLSELDIPVIIFDFSKRNYKDLLSTHLKDKVRIYTVGRDVAPFKFNPLIPPEGTSLSQWMKEFSSIFDHAYWLLGGGKHIILKAISAVYMEKDNPRLKDLKFWLRDYAATSLTPREKNWISTAERPLESLNFKDVGEIFDCNQGIKPSEFFKKGQITILELDALDTNDRTFFIEIIMQWIRDWLIVNGKREEMMGAIILEEAHHVLNREKSKQLGIETVIDLVFREIRELGVGVVYIDQHPSLVSYPALGNTSTHIYMNLGLDTKHSSDIQDATNMLGLNYDEEKGYLRKLPIGHGFVLNRMSSFTDPFLVQFPKFPMTKGSISDAQITAHMQEHIFEEPAEKAEEKEVQFNDNSLEFEKPEAEPKVEKVQAREETKIDRKVDDSSIDENCWKIIKAIGEGKGVFTSQIYKSLSMSGTVFKKRIDSLISTGIVGFRHAKIGKNKMIFYFLTTGGQKLFDQNFETRDVKERIDIESIKSMFDLAGWNWTQEGEGRVSVDVSGNKILIALKESGDRKDLYNSVSDKIYHYIVGGPTVKNLLLQEVARYSRNSGEVMIIHISISDKFEKNGSFEKIEFLPH